MFDSGSAGVLAKLGDRINPATEESQTDIVNAVSTPGSIGDGRKTVSSAGTREQLSTTLTIKKVEITALENNTDVVVIGGSTVVALYATRRGTPIRPGETLTVYINDLAKIYIDALTSGDGVSYTYFV